MESFEREYSQGLRVNTRKISPEAFLGLWGDPLESVPWCPAGFYLSPGGKPPSKHPFYLRGYCGSPAPCRRLSFPLNRDGV
ncbi:MAG: hypothetical protein ACLTXL_10830 [Clostridia bacterium]